MRHSYWACLIAIAVGGCCLFVKAIFGQQWLATGLSYLAILIALLATLGLAHDSGLWSRIAARRRHSTIGHAGKQRASAQGAANVTARVQVPRPAGPAGPVPVLQKKP